MKVHVGADINTGVVHTSSIASTNVADIKERPKLLREEDKAVFGDRGYNEYQQAARKAGVLLGHKSAAEEKASEVYKIQRNHPKCVSSLHADRVDKLVFDEKKFIGKTGELRRKYGKVEKNRDKKGMLRSF